MANGRLNKYITNNNQTTSTNSGRLNKYINNNINNTQEKENKSILKTASAGLQYLGQSVLGKMEDIFIDTPLQIAAETRKLFGDDKGANALMEASNISLTNALINTAAGKENNPYINNNQNLWNEEVDKNSYIKEDNLGGQIVKGIGGMLPVIAIGGSINGGQKTKEIGSRLLQGSSAFSSGVNEAYQESGDMGKSMLYGLGNAGIEFATESLSGGIPGLKQINGTTKKEIAKNYLKSVAGEGVEEIASSLVNPVLQTIYKGSDSLNQYGTSDYWKDVVESGVVGAAVGGILDSPNTISSLRNSQKSLKTTANSNVNTQSGINTLIHDNNVENGLNYTKNVALKGRTLPTYKDILSVENNLNLDYNKNEGDINDKRRNISSMGKDGTNVGRGMGNIQTNEGVSNILQTNNERVNKNQEGTTIEQGYGTTNERREYFERVKNNSSKESTNEQIELQNEIKELGIDLKYFVGENDGTILGTTDNDIIYLDVNENNLINEDSNLRQRFYHELFHNIKRNKNLNFETEINELKQYVAENNDEAINKYIENRGYDSSLFSNSKKMKLRLAEEVLSDYSAKYLAQYNIDYNLSQEVEYRLNTLLDDAITTMKLNKKNSYSQLKGDKLPKASDIQDTGNVENITKLPTAKRDIPQDPTKESSYDNDIKKTRKQVGFELLNEMGISEQDIAKGNDISSIDLSRTDPIRVNEKVFGAEIGQKINDATINKTKHNEAERTRWLNKERNEIKELGIKAQSKESDAVQKYGEKQYITRNNEVIPYGDAELARDFPDVETQNKIKKASRIIRSKYDNYIEQINEVLVDMGYNPIKKRPDYMRHFQALNDVFSRFGTPLNAESLQNDSLPTDINGLTDQFKPGKNFFTNAMERMGLKTEYDAITGIDGYLEGASNLIFHTEDIQRYRTLSKLIRDTYGSKNGYEDFETMTLKEQEQRIADIRSNKLSKYAAWLDEQANSLAGKKGKIDRGAEELFGRKVYTVLQTAKKQVGSNMTGFNVRSALTNFASTIQGASKTNKMAFLKGTISTINNCIHKDGLIDKSDFLTSRFGSDSLSPKLWQKMSNAGQVLMEGSDYFTANQIWRSKYYENLSNGMSESEAIRSADDFASRIMGDRSKGSTATIFNSNTLGFLTQFQLEVNNQWSSLIHDNKMDVQRGNKTGASVVFQLGQLFAMSYMFNGMMKSLTGSGVMLDPIDLLKKIFNPDDEEEKSLEERAREALGEVIDNIPFASIFTDGGRIPISEAFNGATTGIKYLTGQSNEYGNKYTLSDVGSDIIESAFYWLLPTGYGQAKKTIKGASMYSGKLPTAGSYTNSGNLRFTADKTLTGISKALTFGQYSSKEAQDYIDSGYKTISKNYIQEMKDLGMTSTEYRKYRTGLSKAGTTNSEKLDYINSLDVSIEQKNIMANNVVDSDKYTVDMSNYNDYGSYETMKYALQNPTNYSIITSITNYDDYLSYKDEVNNIKEEYSGTENSTIRKQKVFKYVNSLPYSRVEKIILFKMLGNYGISDYKNDVYNYINGLDISKSEKEQMWQQIYGK